MHIICTLQYKHAPTKEALKNTLWSWWQCFSFLKRKQPLRHFLCELSNKFDSSAVTNSHSTKEWHNLIRELLPKHIQWKITYKHSEKYGNAFQIYLDLSKISYPWALSLLTLLRYPAEYYNICYNYWKLKEKWPLIKDWDAIYLAHTGSFKEQYQQDFNRGFEISTGHALTGIRGTLKDFSIENTFKELDKHTTPLTKQGTCYTQIGPMWCNAEYHNAINFNSQALLNNNYYFMTEEA